MSHSHAPIDSTRFVAQDTGFMSDELSVIPLGHTRTWIVSFVEEVSYRLGLLFAAPGLRRSRIIERAREDEHRHLLANEYSEGYLAGWRECYAACLDAVEEEVSKNGELWTAAEAIVDTASFPRPN